MSAKEPAPFDLAAACALEKRVWEMLEAGDAKNAINACEKLNRQFPDFASGWHTASHLALKLGNPKMALLMKVIWGILLVGMLVFGLSYQPPTT